MPLKRIYNGDEFFRLSHFADGFELIKGVLHPRNDWREHYAEVGLTLGLRIGIYVTEHGLGRLFTQHTRFLIRRDPDLIVQPDAAFLRTGRLEEATDNEEPIAMVPDLVIDLASLIESFEDAEARLRQYEHAGVPIVWLIRPSRYTVIAQVSGHPPATLTEQDTLDGGDILPGFQLPVAEIFR